MAEQKWPIESTRDLANALEWLRKRSDAVLLVAIRREDIAWAAPWGTTPALAEALLEQQMPTLVHNMIRSREGGSYSANSGTIGGCLLRGDAWES